MTPFKNPKNPTFVFQKRSLKSGLIFITEQLTSWHHELKLVPFSKNLSSFDGNSANLKPKKVFLQNIMDFLLSRLFAKCEWILLDIDFDNCNLVIIIFSAFEARKNFAFFLRDGHRIVIVAGSLVRNLFTIPKGFHAVSCSVECHPQQLVRLEVFAAWDGAVIYRVKFDDCLCRVCC